MDNYFDNLIRFVAVVGGTIAFFAVFINLGFGISITNDLKQTATVSAVIESKATDASLEITDEPSTTLIFVGDIMLSRGIGKIIDSNGNPEFPFEHVKDFLRGADVTFGNLESPISGRGKNQGSIYTFNADPYTVLGLADAGFDIVSVANNHILDYGTQALIDTLALLKIHKIDSVGAGTDYQHAHEPVIKTINDTKIAFLAYTNLIPKSYGKENATPAISYLDEEVMERDITYAQNIADIVVVSFHWGEEYQITHNEWQEHVAKKAVDAGASLIIGHHPHVVQEVEKYKNSFIAYSLGNFIFDQNFSEDTGKGLVLEAIIKDKKITEIQTIGVAFNSSFQPVLHDQ